MNEQRDPLQTIAEAIQTLVEPFGIKETILGWPDPKQFDVDGSLPILAIFPVSDGGKTVTSTETIHATVDNGDGTVTVYKERLRKVYTLQFSLFTYTAEDRSNIGWSIEQYFTTNRRLEFGIAGVESGIFKYRGQRNPQGETKFFQRDITYEVTARVLDATTGVHKAGTIRMNSTISAGDPDPQPETSDIT